MVSFNLLCGKMEIIKKTFDIWYEICIWPSHFSLLTLVWTFWQNLSSAFKSTLSLSLQFSEEDAHFFLSSKDNEKSAEFLRMLNYKVPLDPKILTLITQRGRNNFFLTSTGYITKLLVEIVSCFLIDYVNRSLLHLLPIISKFIIFARSK